MSKARWTNKQQLIDLGITDVSPDGELLVHNGRLVHSSINHCGYKKFYFIHNKVGINIYCHRAVWLWFCNNIPEGYVVDHLDHDTHNNYISNLRLLTELENQRNKNKVSIRITDEYREYSRNYCKQRYAKQKAKAVSLGSSAEDSADC